MDVRKTLGKRIKALRGYSLLTQEQLGGKIGVAKQSISDWERGVRSPDVDNLVSLSKALNCTCDYLLGLVDEPHQHYGSMS